MNIIATDWGGAIIIGIAAVIIISIAAYFMIRMMKGKVEIELPTRGYNSGEEISGTVTLTSRKELKMNRFYVALIGYELIERFDSEGARKTRKNEIYRYEHNFTEAGSLRTGTTQKFEFNLIAPGSTTQAGDSELSGQVAGAITTAAKVIGAISGSSRRLEWKLEARVDLPGVDIASSEKLRINYI